MLAQALLAPILLHAEYINEDAEFADEDVMDVYLDEDEWSRVRTSFALVYPQLRHAS